MQFWVQNQIWLNIGSSKIIIHLRSSSIKGCFPSPPTGPRFHKGQNIHFLPLIIHISCLFETLQIFILIMQGGGGGLKLENSWLHNMCFLTIASDFSLDKKRTLWCFRWEPSLYEPLYVCLSVPKTVRFSNPLCFCPSVPMPQYLSILGSQCQLDPVSWGFKFCIPFLSSVIMILFYFILFNLLWFHLILFLYTILFHFTLFYSI